ncbi:hypothetical protein [Pseudomonas phage BL1]|nr:hypothetical protein [Pseudomonas phage BL1]
MANILLACALTVGDEILTHVDDSDPIRRRAIVLRTSPAPHNKVSAEVSALVGGEWKDFGIKFVRDYPIISLDSIG